jgi:Ca2+-binding EF-hand superfamily protein
MFAGALLSRSRIPSQQYSDPLMHIFDEVDADSDGALTASEVASALRSRNVNITEDQAAMFIDAVDLNHTKKVERHEFRDLILHMAAADLHFRKKEHDEEQDGAWVTCSLEEDEEIKERLKAWIDNLVFRRYK